jgi:hypothetical protein
MPASPGGPDVVLADVRARMDGLTFLRRAKGGGEASFVMMTGSPASGHSRGDAPGRRNYLVKCST